MNNEHSFYNQLKSIRLLLMKIYMPALILLFGIALLKIIFRVDIGSITRDSLQLFEAPPFVGILSNIGILCWCSVMAISFFASRLIQREADRGKMAQFLFYSGLLTCFLMLDDFFLFHEIVLPDYLHIRQELIYPSYLIIIITYLIKFCKIILRTDYIFLVLAFMFFGVSISIDLVSEIITIPELFFFEDGSKFMGVLSWAVYFIRTGLQVMNGQLSTI